VDIRPGSVCSAATCAPSGVRGRHRYGAALADRGTPVANKGGPRNTSIRTGTSWWAPLMVGDYGPGAAATRGKEVCHWICLPFLRLIGFALDPITKRLMRKRQALSKDKRCGTPCAPPDFCCCAGGRLPRGRRYGSGKVEIKTMRGQGRHPSGAALRLARTDPAPRPPHQVRHRANKKLWDACPNTGTNPPHITLLFGHHSWKPPPQFSSAMKPMPSSQSAARSP